jgi:cytochrome c oxidase subunit IV
MPHFTELFAFRILSQHAEKYIKKGGLNWRGATTIESVRAVLKLPRLQVNWTRLLMLGCLILPPVFSIFFPTLLLHLATHLRIKPCR